MQERRTGEQQGNMMRLRRLIPLRGVKGRRALLMELGCGRSLVFAAIAPQPTIARPQDAVNGKIQR